MNASFCKLTALTLIAASYVNLPASAETLAKISVATYQSPSLGAFLSPVIKAQKIDEKNGLLLEFHEFTPDAYAAAFNSGQYQVSASAASLTIGLADTRHVHVANLFNVFDFWCAVVTSRPNINKIKDLEGKDIAAAMGTTSYQMFEWFAKRQGVDTTKFSVLNTATPGLIGYALANRASAVELWEPAYTILKTRQPRIKTLDLKLRETWTKFSGSPIIPYQGVAAHRGWIRKHSDLVPKLFQTYKDASEWMISHPDQAAALISPRSTKEARDAIAELIRSPERLGLNVKWAHELRSEIGSVYKLGREVNVLSSDPSPDSIYEGPDK